MKKTTSLFSSLALVTTLLIANLGLTRMNGNQHNPDSSWKNSGNSQIGRCQPGMTDDNHTYPSGLWSADDSLMNQHNDYTGDNYHAAD